MTAAPVTHAENWHALAKLRVVVGLVCIAVLVLEYAGQLGLRPTAQPFSQLGEATSYHSLLYDLVGFWLPGGLLVLFGIGLRRVLGPSWLSAGALVLLTVLGMCTVLLGLLPYSPDSLQTRLARQAARALYLWSPICAAFLVGGALLTQRLRGQAAFSIGCGVLMAVLAFWLTAFSATSADWAPVEIATPWYVETAAWLLQQPAVAGRRRWSKLVERPFIMIRLLAAVGIAALAAYVTDIGVPLLPVAIAQMDGRTQVATLGEGVLGGYSYASFNDVIGVWREIDGCAASASMSVSGPTTTTIWPCRAGSTVETKLIEGGQHYWPGPTAGVLRLPWATDTREAFDASAVIADYFVAHPRTGGTAVSR